MKPETFAPLCLGLAVLAASALTASSPAGVDPFYASRFHEGRAAYDRGDYHEASFSLRLACFGMLEAPEELAECLVWLALAQAGADDQEGFAATFRRLAEGEDLVGLYSRSQLPSELRGAFEARALEWIPEATLAAIPAFSELADRQSTSQLPPSPPSVVSLEPSARRDGNSDPRTGAAREMLDRAEGVAAAARTRQDLDEAYRLSLELVKGYPDFRSGHLLAAEIAYRASRWPEAVAHFREAGPPGPDQPELVFYFAVSLYESGERAEAAEVLRCCADRLRSTAFVDQYVRRILGES